MFMTFQLTCSFAKRATEYVVHETGSLLAVFERAVIKASLFLFYTR